MADESDLDLYHEAEIKGNPMAKIEVLNRARQNYINNMQNNHPTDRYTHQNKLKDENSLLTNYIDGKKSEIYSRMGARDANSTPSSSYSVRGPNTPRKKTPTKEEQEVANLEKIANQKNIQIEKSGNGYKVFQNNTLIATMAGIGFLIVFLMALLFPKMKHGSQNAGTSRKSKKSSRRNRK